MCAISAARGITPALDMAQSWGRQSAPVVILEIAAYNFAGRSPAILCHPYVREMKLVPAGKPAGGRLGSLTNLPQSNGHRQPANRQSAKFDHPREKVLQ